jgi:isoleucyl-tRNA synthetase
VLARLLAPILPHTAEELWDFVPKGDAGAGADMPDSVHLAEWPELDPAWDDDGRDAEWADLMAIRVEILRVLEKLRAAKVIGSSQEASVRIGSDDPAIAARLERHRDLLPTLAIVSEVAVGGAMPEGAARGIDLTSVWVEASKSSHGKCERCWNLRPGVGRDVEHPTLCERCARVVRDLNAGARGE